ncbi:MAG: GNAT family N-acetyltransferase [Candidatus Latescibacteria bacterium]|nr:GNAT family N-acetyltransferase [Candidatus Latescibacterota bacterium]
MFHIRPYKDGDLRKLNDLYREFYTLHHRDFSGGRAMSTEGAEASVKEFVVKEDSWILVAEHDSTQVVGFVRFERRDSCFFGGELFVHLNWRRRGIGTALLDAQEKWIREHGGNAVYLSVVPANRGMFGFIFKRGYDTLNTVELCKDFDPEKAARRRSEMEFLGLPFKLK